MKDKASIANQMDKAFNLGNIMSDGRGDEGDERLPNPPIVIGIIIKGIVNNPWKVIFGLYWGAGHIERPGKANSNRGIEDDP